MPIEKNEKDQQLATTEQIKSATVILQAYTQNLPENEDPLYLLYSAITEKNNYSAKDGLAEMSWLFESLTTFFLNPVNANQFFDVSGNRHLLPDFLPSLLDMFKKLSLSDRATAFFEHYRFCNYSDISAEDCQQVSDYYGQKLALATYEYTLKNGIDKH